MWKTDMNSEMNNKGRSLPEGVFVWIKLPFLWGRGLKIDTSIMSLYSSSIRICEATWRDAKTTNRRSKDLVEQRRCQQSELWSSNVVDFWMSAFLPFFFSSTPHTLSSVNTGPLVWNCWMFAALWDGVQIQMAIQMGQSKWLAWVSLAAAL